MVNKTWHSYIKQNSVIPGLHRKLEEIDCKADIFITIEYLNYPNCWDNEGFYVLFNSIPVILGHWVGDNEMLCAMELSLRLRRCCLKQESNPDR